jgi:SAM-dependent methyltransferase
MRAPQPQLVCPRCRCVDGDELSIASLAALPTHLHCDRCDAHYPIVDGVRIVLQDVAAWQADAKDDPALVRIFERRDAGPLAHRVDAVVSGLTGNVLDMGCGAGALYRRRDLTAFDWSLGMARAYASHAFVADARDPPFEPARFDAVLLLNVLDACANPRLVLAQADTLLCDSGTLVVSCPYAWTDRVPPAERFGADDLVAAIEDGNAALGLRSRYRIVMLEDPVTWRLRLSSRLVQEYGCQFLVATKHRV